MRFLFGFVTGMVALAAALWIFGGLKTRDLAGESRNLPQASRELPDTSRPAPRAPISVPPPVPAPQPPPQVQPQGEAHRAAEPVDLESRQLVFPVQGVDRGNMIDTFDQTRPGGRRHEAVDIMAPRGTPVVAADEGNVVKLFQSKQGGLTVYQFDNSRTYCYYYAHLDRYARSLQEGTLLRKGDVLGYVGSTGDASPEAPHLHFAIFKLGPEKNWWQGTPINPYPLLRNAIIRSK